VSVAASRHFVRFLSLRSQGLGVGLEFTVPWVATYVVGMRHAVSLLGWHDVHSPPAQQLRLLRLIILVIMIVVYVCSGCRQEFSQLRHCHAHRSKAGTARAGGSYQQAGASCAAAYPMTPSTLRMTHGARSRPTIYLTCSVFCAVSLQESPLSCASCGFVAVTHHQ